MKDRDSLVKLEDILLCIGQTKITHESMFYERNLTTTIHIKPIELCFTTCNCQFTLL